MGIFRQRSGDRVNCLHSGFGRMNTTRVVGVTINLDSFFLICTRGTSWPHRNTSVLLSTCDSIQIQHHCYKMIGLHGIGLCTALLQSYVEYWHYATGKPRAQSVGLYTFAGSKLPVLFCGNRDPLTHGCQRREWPNSQFLTSVSKRGLSKIWCVGFNLLKDMIWDWFGVDYQVEYPTNTSPTRQTQAHHTATRPKSVSSHLFHHRKFDHMSKLAMVPIDHPPRK